ncbi:hypothetical protein RND71_018190 [Anisodus tanguticus]|uniref:Uncharacterized protein n=1 Tax=Anisodus tanguticus TaxID=243964 RepID=A0AAE1VJ23_9SOLA|nr:hypothetical protein RND71_018190 [Anisodus tanguticus]
MDECSSSNKSQIDPTPETTTEMEATSSCKGVARALELVNMTPRSSIPGEVTEEMPTEPTPALVEKEQVQTKLPDLDKHNKEQSSPKTTWTNLFAGNRSAENDFLGLDCICGFKWLNQ